MGDRDTPPPAPPGELIKVEAPVGRETSPKAGCGPAGTSGSGHQGFGERRGSAVGGTRVWGHLGAAFVRGAVIWGRMGCSNIGVGRRRAPRQTHQRLRGRSPRTAAWWGGRVWRGRCSKRVSPREGARDRVCASLLGKQTKRKRRKTCARQVRAGWFVNRTPVGGVSVLLIVPLPQKERAAWGFEGLRQICKRLPGVSLRK